jgi:hypothetical protein
MSYVLLTYKDLVSSSTPAVLLLWYALSSFGCQQ